MALTFTGIVLAGGKSIRMGCDKALLTWQNKTWLAHIVDILYEAGAHDVIVSRDTTTAYTTVPDTIENSGPLGGVYSAITHGLNSANKHSTQAFLVVPVDMPTLKQSSIHKLISSIDEQHDLLGDQRHNPLHNPRHDLQYSAVCYQNSPLPFLIKAETACLNSLQRILRDDKAKKSIWHFLETVNTRVLQEDIAEPNFNSEKDINKYR